MSLKLFCNTDFDRENRLFLAAGITYTGLPQEHYEADSPIPVLPLSNAVPADISTDLAGFEHKNSLCFFRCNEQKLRDIFLNLDISAVTSQEELAALSVSRYNVYNIFTGRMNKYFKQYTNTDFTQHDIYVGGKSQHTSTIDFDLEVPKKVGLHVDNWDRLPVSELDQAKNRICINLGRAHRYFLFINEEVMTMRSKLAGINSDLGRVENSNEIARRYLLAFPDTKICFFRLAPFEGYIVPTENVMHDASNFDSADTDIQLTARGFFSPAYFAASRS